jgi:hypothetical protein
LGLEGMKRPLSPSLEVGDGVNGCVGSWKLEEKTREGIACRLGGGRDAGPAEAVILVARGRIPVVYLIAELDINAPAN